MFGGKNGPRKSERIQHVDRSTPTEAVDEHFAVDLANGERRTAIIVRRTASQPAIRTSLFDALKPVEQRRGAHNGTTGAASWERMR
jgi:hypothetical protein